MNKRIIKLKFVDGYVGFNPEDSALFKTISKDFDIQLCDDPDYIIYQPYGHKHLKYDCVKIFFTGENCTPDFNVCDYAIGFDHLDFGDRYLRCPLYAVRENFKGFRSLECPTREALLNRKFCSFVVSNFRGDPMRFKFFERLSKYKKVDSGGWCLNNVGGPVEDKDKFLAEYKFNIAFENSSYPGYVTEKIMDALGQYSVPIYWGAPDVDKDFIPGTFVRVKDESDVERAVEEVIRLDQDDAAYLRMVGSPCLVQPVREYYQDKLHQFLTKIFDQPLGEARRICSFGSQSVFYRQSLREAFSRLDFTNRFNPILGAKRIKRKIVKLFK